MRKLRRLPWRLPKQNAGSDHAPAPRRESRAERDEREEREARAEPTQPVAYIGGRYVYGGPGGAPRTRTRGPRPY